MGPRVARSGLQAGSQKKNARNKNRKRTLDAYSIASHSVPDRNNRRSHRLGEYIDDGPQSKKRRVDSDEEGSDQDDDDEAGQHARVKRRGPPRDDGVEEGSDSDGNHWTLGSLAEDDDDSDIDSDEAFGESDEEKFEGFTFRGSSTAAKKSKARKPSRKQVTADDEDFDLDEGLNDGVEDDDDSLGDEAVDLATMLDDDNGDDDLDHEGRSDIDSNEESGSEEDGDESGDNDLSSSDDEDDSEDDGAHDEERMARLRDRLEEMDEKPEVSTAPKSTETISVEDLLADIDPSSRAQFAAPLKTKKSAQPTTLAAPLPKRQQDRIDREIASQKAKENLDRWQDTVIHNRRADHLSFPLRDPDASEPRGKDKFLITAPQNELEENIQRIMVESGLATKQDRPLDDDQDDALMKSEELATRAMPVEEVMRRRAELRRARELLFREEIKAKRIAKIKSKSYRRVHRKERERLAEKERALMDPEGLGLPMDEDEREMLDRKRAEERMSTKHRESKWAKSLKATNRATWDETARDSVNEQARRMEDLKRRIAGKDVGSGNESDSFSDDEDDENDENNVTTTLQRLQKLSADGQDSSKNRLGNMKFMQAADARRKAQNDEDILRLRKELSDGDQETDSGDEINDQGLGRAIFGPKAPASAVVQTKPKRPVLEEGEYSDDPDVNVAGLTSEPQVVKQKATKAHERGATKAENLGTRRLGGLSAQPVEKDDMGLSWLTDVAAKKTKKDRKEQQLHNDDTVILTDLGAKTQLGPGGTTSTRASGAKSDKKPSAATPNRKDTASAESVRPPRSDDEDDANPILSAEQQKAAYHARAFAGDDVKLAFDAEKDAAVASEDEKEISTHLPGWGSWTGDGLSKSIRKANAKQKHNPLFKTKLPGGVKAENRKDKRLSNVIISEKQDRKGKKYLAPMLPHGFEHKDQYERSLRAPVGPEWTTKETFQRNTRPRVVVKQGIVAPMERPLL